MSNYRLSWPAFRRSQDLLDLSHRGLQRHLIPNWLSHPKTLGEQIESSAYGETPPALIERALSMLGVAPGGLFVDLGSGGGNVCAAALKRGARVLGIERNPLLHQAALEFLEPSEGLELRCADFLPSDWQDATWLYCTTARFPQGLLHQLAPLVESCPRLQAVVCLGRPLELGPEWLVRPNETIEVRWNAGEESLKERLFSYRRKPA